MSRPLREQVIVITGASTGIGRETALTAAGRGAKLVLAARGEKALHEVAERIRAAGGEVLVVPTDVADAEQVEHLARAAVERFGRVDTWVNNAGVAAYATVEQMTPQEYERIVHVDLLGPIYGCRAVLPHMRRAGGGTIINVGSGYSARSVPLMSAYCAAKAGLKGFTDALRMELMRDAGDAPIAVTLILPSAVNTPLFEHARSKLGVKPAPVGTVYEPSVVAEAILFAAEHPRRDVYAGGGSKLLSVMERISPALLDWYMVHNDKLFKQQQTDEPDDGEDNLFAPAPNGRSSRGSQVGAHKRSYYTRYVELHPNVKRAVITGAVAAGILLARALAGRSAGGSKGRSGASIAARRQGRIP